MKRPSIKEPKGFNRLKRDHRGLPVPFAMLQEPLSQTTVDPPRLYDCLQRKLCAVCGLKLDNKKWFIGGYRTMVYRVFVDGPMHEACARYSLQVCPFLSNPDQKYRTKPERAGDTMLRRSAPTRMGGVQILMRTKGYRQNTLNHTLVAVAEPWEYWEYWQRGKKLDHAPVGPPTIEAYQAYLKAGRLLGIFPELLVSYQDWASDKLDWTTTPMGGCPHKGA